MTHIFGIHSVKAWLKSSSPATGDFILVDAKRQDRRLRELRSDAEKSRVGVRLVDKKELDRIVRGAVHQGVVVETKDSTVLKTYDENALQDLLDSIDSRDELPFLLILDGVTDPHNLGACLRSAEAAGVDAVIVPKDRSAGITPVVRKVASGAVETLPFVKVTNLARTLKALADRGIWIVGAAGEAVDTLHGVDLKGPIAIVMGAEGGGMRRLTIENCSQLIKIPMAGEVSSLNVSVASGVVLFEAVRQRVKYTP